MTREYRAKTFKSGNSVALRLPAGMGVEPGREMRVREEQGRFVVEPADTRRKITGEGWMGMIPGLKPLTPKDREFDPSPRVWDDPDWKGWGEDS